VSQVATEWDALTGATALDQHRTLHLQNVRRKVINWHIPVGFLSALLTATLLHNLLHSEPLSIPVNMFGGATMLCAFFISTDPVSAAVSNRGRVIYAAITGLLVYIIRAYGAYPDGVAFAVLLANCTVPAIDRMDSFFNRATDGNNP